MIVSSFIATSRTELFWCICALNTFPKLPYIVVSHNSIVTMYCGTYFAKLLVNTQCSIIQRAAQQIRDNVINSHLATVDIEIQVTVNLRLNQFL